MVFIFGVLYASQTKQNLLPDMYDQGGDSICFKLKFSCYFIIVLEASVWITSAFPSPSFS
jgi:hypothetical protein